MLTNLDRYKNDLGSLIAKGDDLLNAMLAECFPDKITERLRKEFEKAGISKPLIGKKTKEYFDSLPTFQQAYQSWYSEAKAMVKQLLPDRLADFVRHYEKAKPRKDITYANYTIEDYLQGLNVNRLSGLQREKIVGPDAAIPQFQQQLAIVQSVKARFESSLFDIRQLVQADLFDSELEAAEELAKNKFTRAAGAVAGVVLERHLAQVCDNHNIKVAKQNPTISDLNDILKGANVVDIPQWRFIQHLADIRNLCDHNKVVEPTIEQVNDLVQGVRKISKTLF
jgi:hypothetical protein